MLSDALSDLRMFSVAHADEDFEQDWEPIGTLGVVRACVTNEDGTSNLILQGVARVEFSNYSITPYPQADIKILRDPKGTTEEIEKLRQSVMQQLLEEPIFQKRLPEGFLNHLAALPSPAAFADLVASTALMDPMSRRLVLEELDVLVRMEILLGSLGEESSGCEPEDEED